MLPILYLQISLPDFRFKIGITNRGLGKRSRNIAETTPGLQMPVFFCVVPFPAMFERALHRHFAYCHAPKRRGSGKTEWFGFGLFGLNFVGVLGFYACIWVVEALIVWWVWGQCFG